MLLLGIDTSGKTASTALYDTENQVFLAESTLYTQKTHSQVIMPEVKAMLEQTGKSINEIGGIAVANGPGSYTGLRIGVAAVKAMSFVLGCKCCGVSTLESLAYNNTAFSGVICSLMKARADVVYCAVYKSDGKILEPIKEEALTERSELSEYLKDLGCEVLLCGDGAEDFIKDFESDKFRTAPPHGRLQNACGVCLAAVNNEFKDAEELEVSYLQKVKAEKELEEKNKQRSVEE